MTYPYGRRDKIKLVWEDCSHSSKSRLVRGTVEFSGSQKHCAEENIRWLYKKGFIDPVSVAWLAMKLDIRLYGRFQKMINGNESLVSKPSKSPVLQANV